MQYAAWQGAPCMMYPEPGSNRHELASIGV